MALNPVAFQQPSLRKIPVGRVLIIGRNSELGKPFEDDLTERDCSFDYAAGSADALRQLRQNAYSVVVTDPANGVDEDLALLSEMRAIRPGVRAIVLASTSTPEEVIAALRARVFLCKTPPFDPAEIAEYVAQAAASADSLLAIEVVSAHRDWISLRMNCQMLTAERLVAFLKELQSELPQTPREELMMAFREILMNAVEHGASGQP